MILLESREALKTFQAFDFKMARWEGLEPPTRWLTATCSTTELPANMLKRRPDEPIQVLPLFLEDGPNFSLIKDPIPLKSRLKNPQEAFRGVDSIKLGRPYRLPIAVKPLNERAP